VKRCGVSGSAATLYLRFNPAIADAIPQLRPLREAWTIEVTSAVFQISKTSRRIAGDEIIIVKGMNKDSVKLRNGLRSITCGPALIH